MGIEPERLPTMLDKVEVRGIWRPVDYIIPTLLQPVGDHVCGVDGSVIVYEDG